MENLSVTTLLFFIPLHTVLVHFLSLFPLFFLLLFFKWELFLSQSTLILFIIISVYLNVSSSYTTLIYLFQYFYSLFLFIWEISLVSSLMNILYHILFILSVDFFKSFLIFFFPYHSFLYSFSSVYNISLRIFFFLYFAPSSFFF